MKNQPLFLFKLVLIITFLTSPVFAQTTSNSVTAKTSTTANTNTTVKKKPYKAIKKFVDTVLNTDFSLNGQYNFMLLRSKNLNGYKLVNPVRLTGVWKSVKDTLKKEREELKQARSKIEQMKASISELKGNVKEKENNITNANENIDKIFFLGVNFNEVTYNVIVWSIILILIFVLLAVIVKSTKKISEAKNRALLYDEISAEYQAYKAKAGEKERRLARELQNERNALEELKNRGA